MPQWLESREPVYRVVSPAGYDGQWFHLLAHRPLEMRESAQFMDAPALRCQRILLPLAAWLLAGGRFEWVDPAYFSLILASLGAGTWWTARLAELRGASPAWGLLFLLLPSSLSSIDRMLADGPLVAAAAGFFYYLETDSPRAAWIIALIAPFIRETGLLLVAAGSACQALRRRWKECLAWMIAVIPFLLWVHSLRDLPGRTQFVWKGLFSSAIRILTDPADYPFGPWIRIVLHALDLASLAGFLCSTALCLVLIWRKRTAGADDAKWPTWLTGAGFGGAALILVNLEPRHAWDDFYAYGRVFSIIFLVLLLDGLDRRRPLLALGLLAPVAARMAAQFASPAWRILKGLSGI
ncbi:MAG: hypothetical protein N2036_10985 [Bryobacteraceae bacterium]|nr:hypothetical protein [Bryobacteraceae bacterium]